MTLKVGELRLYACLNGDLLVLELVSFKSKAYLPAEALSIKPCDLLALTLLVLVSFELDDDVAGKMLGLCLVGFVLND